MATILPSDLLDPTEKKIKNWNCSFIAVDGPTILDKINLEDLEIPYESQYRSRIVLKAGELEKPLIYGFIGKSVTFLMIKVTYPFIEYEENFNISYHFENDPILRPLNKLMILTGSIDERIPQIYLSNYLDYDVILDVMHATIDTEYDDTAGIPTYQTRFNFNTVLTSYTGLTTDQYIRCSGTTESGSTYTLYLPMSTGSGNVLMIKNIANGVITVEAQDGQTIDYSLIPITLNQNQVLKLIDVGDDNWDNLNI